MFFDVVDEVMGVISGELFDVKVVYTEEKFSFECLVAPEAWCIFYRFISIWGDFLDELFECKDYGFFEAVHAMEDFKLYVHISFDMEV